MLRWVFLKRILVKPVTAYKGVLNSCVTVDKKLDLAFMAKIASSLAFSSSVFLPCNKSLVLTLIWLFLNRETANSEITVKNAKDKIAVTSARFSDSVSS